MAEKSIRATKSGDKPTDKPTAKRKPVAKPRTPHHDEISERAYLIHLEGGGSDALANWLRAERELTEA